MATQRSHYQLAVEQGDKRVVGVNCLTESISTELEILRVSHEVERDPGQPS
jgi:methylmalonyl-CoA mutase N-terminal domain/subunit